MSEFFRFSAGSFSEQNDAAPTPQFFPTKPAADARPPEATDIEAGLLIFCERREVSVEVYEIHDARRLKQKDRSILENWCGRPRSNGTALSSRWISLPPWALAALPWRARALGTPRLPLLACALKLWSSNSNGEAE